MRDRIENVTSQSARGNTDRVGNGSGGRSRVERWGRSIGCRRRLMAILMRDEKIVKKNSFFQVTFVGASPRQHRHTNSCLKILENHMLRRERLPAPPSAAFSDDVVTADGRGVTRNNLIKPSCSLGGGMPWPRKSSAWPSSPAPAGASGGRSRWGWRATAGRW